MQFAQIPAEYQAAVIAYRDANGRQWKRKLVDDWLSDHRRQWGALRVVRNAYCTEGLQAFLDSVPAATKVSS